MRRIVMFNNVSADGFFADQDGKLDWVVVNDEMNRKAMGNTGKFDTVLFGRRTYELFVNFWPHVLENPAGSSNPHSPGKVTPETRAMAEFLDNANKIVFSKTLKNPIWKNTRVVRDINPREIASLKKQKGDDMILFGSGTIVRQLTENRLIDEYQFVVSPVILGGGKTMMSGDSLNLGLKLLESKQYKSGNVILRYALRK